MFSQFSNILPDPVFRISNSGALDQSSGAPGPGFSQVEMTAIENATLARTRAGGGVPRTDGSHYWQLNISYHQLTEAELAPLRGFMSARNRKVSPFFVVLPHRSKPRDPTFATFAVTNPILLAAQVGAGVSYGTIRAGTSILGNPSPGDLFNVKDSADTNHMKTYEVTRVETPTDYYVPYGPVPAGQRRIHFSPPMSRVARLNSELVFISPKIRVVSPAGSNIPSNIDSNNLYSYGPLQLEELVP